MNIRNVRNTMCRLSDLTNEQIDSLVDEMPDSCHFDFYGAETHIGVTRNGDWGTWTGGTAPSIVTYTEMMQLLGKEMKEFTKSDLKTGMFVKQRRGEFKIVLDDVISSDKAWSELSSYSEDMMFQSRAFAELDIVAVYKCRKGRKGGCISDYLSYLPSYLKGDNLTPIWERTEQTEAQKEMEVLQEQAKALKEQAKAVQEQITKLQGKL